MSISGLLVGILWLVPPYVLAGIIVPVIWDSYDFSQMRTWLESLLRRGYDGGAVVFTHKPTGRYLRFRKYIRPRGEYGLELCFPKVAWSAPHLPPLEAYCAETGLACRFESLKSMGRSLDHLVIGCEQDPDRAFNLALKIWTEYFGLPLRARFKLATFDLSYHDELIDSPAHPRISLKEMSGRQRHQLYQKILEPTGLSIADANFALVLVIAQIVAMIAVSIATALSATEPPDWSFSLGGVTFGGSTSSLAFFAGHLCASAGVLWLRYKFKLPGQKMSRLEDLYFAGLRSLDYALPIAVILVWARV